MILNLMKKFQILAHEIKKRMHNREVIKNKSVSTNKENQKINTSFSKDNSTLKDINKLKIKILPYLKKLEKLIAERQSYLDNISEIDKELI